MKTRTVILAAALLAALLAGLYLWGPPSAPPGQKPLLTLSSANAGDFGAAFDARTDPPRLVLLLSPT
jgi:hypothetical protein